MAAATKRILTTHAGSLPRPASLATLLGARYRGQEVDEAVLAREIDTATAMVVRKQAECGIDIVNDGEQARESFFTYVQHRMTGFGGLGTRPPIADMAAFPGYMESMRAHFGSRAVTLGQPPRCVGPVAYTHTGRKAVQEECDAFDSALAAAGQGFAGRFITAASPGIVACAMRNEHYATLEAYVDAVADALREEYEAIAERGYLLQVDGPDLAMERHTTFAERPVEDFVAFVEHVVAAINRATASIPRERLRVHVCWGNYGGPHVFDVPLEAILPALYRLRVGALLLSMANPRHEHEYHVFERMPLPEGMDLIAGVIDTTTNYVEHPEVVAERIERAARAVGDPDRVLAAPDCGFDTSAGYGIVAPDVTWEKLKALRAGADIAARRLYS